MKNKQILYILTIIITFFTFNLNVDAAQELTCLYTKGLNDDKVLLKQDSAGNKYVYLNPKDVMEDAGGWTLKQGYTIKLKGSNINAYMDASGNLLQCPPYSEVTPSTSRLDLFDYDAWLSQKLVTYASTNTNPDGNNLNIIGNKETELTCENLFGGEGGEELLGLVKTAFTILKISIPVLLIAFGTLDFAKAIFAGKEDEMKKAQDKFMKRIAIGVCVFLVPTLLKLILTVANGIWSNISPDFCGII